MIARSSVEHNGSFDQKVSYNHVGGAAVRMPIPQGDRFAAGSTSSQHNTPREVHLWR